MKNPFIGTPEDPFHMSVGVVLLNEKNEVIVHKYDLESNEALRSTIKRSVGVSERIQFYSIMTETPEDGETLMETAERGLIEEFGASGDFMHYLGTTVGTFKRFGSDILIEKAAPFFLYKMTSLDESKRDPNSMESKSEIVAVEMDALINILEKQDEAIHRTDLVYAPIIERAKKLL